ncbi:MAG: glycosyltransferase family 2 protein [Candidatus Schekmanbacteria bacterium]|nr:glycosyltransferase family 2 protein [Candidatus Schekmanbacteria bacterium]
MSATSIIIPNRNHASFLGAAIEGALAQSRPPLEIIVIDDASTDDSAAVAEAYRTAHPGVVRLLRNDQNVGCEGTLNRGIEVAQGDYLVLGSADDRLLNHTCALGVEQLERHSGAAFCCGDTCHFSSDPETGVVEPAGRSTAPVFVSPETFVERFGGGLIAGGAAVARASQVRAAGGLRPELRWHADWFLYMTMAFRSGFCYVPTPFVALRLDAGSYGSAGSANSVWQDAVLTALLETVDRECPDLHGAFVRAAVFDFFGPVLRELVARIPSLQRESIIRLLAPPAADVVAARKHTGARAVIRQALVRHAPILLSAPGPVAVYGAGGHTEMLLEIWEELRLPRPDLLVVSPPAVYRARFGLRVFAIDDPDLRHLGLVVLSSRSYEPAMARVMRQARPNTPFLSIWSRW